VNQENINANRTFGAGQANYAAYPGYAVKNSGANMAGATVLDAPGRAGDAGRYRDRLRDKKAYPNRRRRIITGKELTTPLTGKKAVERAAVQGKEKERIIVKVKTVPVAKKKFPVSAVFSVLIIAFFLLCLICSQIVLNEQNVAINDLNERINSEIKREKILKNELDNKNDLNYIINYAVTELEMVSEDLLQKYYISGRLEDKAEVVEEKNGFAIDFPIMSAIFGD